MLSEVDCKKCGEFMAPGHECKLEAEPAQQPREEDVAKLVAWVQDAAVILTVAKDEGIRISRLNETVASADAVLAPWRKL